MKFFINDCSSILYRGKAWLVMSKFLFFASFLCLLSVSGFSQTTSQIQWSNTVANIDKCYGTKTFIISVKNNRTNLAPITNATIIPTFPAGVTIKANSLVDLTGSFVSNQVLSPAFTSGGITWDGSKFVITNAIPYLGTIRFSVELEASCSANDQSFLTNSYQIKSNGASLADVTDGSDVGSTNAYNVLGAQLSIPTAPTNSVLNNVLVNQTFNQRVKVTNGGSGKVKFLELDVDAGATTNVNTPIITNPKVYETGTSTPIGTATLKSNGKTISVVLDADFSSNQSIDIVYDFTVKNCNNNNRSIVASTLCGTSVCKVSNTVSSIYSVNNVNTTVNTTITETTNFLTFDEIRGGTRDFKLEISNDGSNISRLGQILLLEQGTRDLVDITYPSAATIQILPSSIKITKSDGTVLTNYTLAPYGTKNNDAVVTGGCFTNGDINYAINFNANFFLQPGEKIIITYSYFQCDNSSAPITISSLYAHSRISTTLYRSPYYYHSGNIFSYLTWYNQCGTGFNTSISPTEKVKYTVSSALTESFVPAQVIGAKEFTIEGYARLTATAVLNGVSNTNKVYEVSVKLPAGVSYKPGSYSSTNGYTLKAGYPTIGTDNTVTFRFNDPNVAVETKDIYYKLTALADGINACGALPIIHQTNVEINATGSNPLVSRVQRTDTIRFQCNSTCSTISPVSMVVERSTFGLPDNNNDGYADASGTLDRTKIALYHLRYGDKLIAKNTSAVCGTFSRIQTDQRFYDGRWKAVGQPTIKLKRGGVVSSINGLVTAVGTAQRDFIIQWAGNEPAGWGDYVSTDTVEVTQEYELIQNKFFDANNQQVNIKTAQFSSTTYVASSNTLSTDWTYNGPLKQSAYSYFQNIFLVSGFGYGITPKRALNDGFVTTVALNDGCNPINFGFFYGEGAYSYTFPFEYRPLTAPEEVRIPIPSGLTFNGFHTFVMGYASNPTINDLTPYITTSPSEVVVDFKSFMASRSTKPREFSGLDLYYSFLPQNRCRTSYPTYPLTVMSRIIDLSTPNRTSDSLLLNTLTISTLSNINNPTFGMTTAINQEPANGIATYGFTLANPSTAVPANNVWVYLKSRRSNATISNVKLNGTAVSPNANGIYLVGDLAVGSTARAFTFDLALDNGCVKDTVDIYYGSECNTLSIPTDVLSYPCKSLQSVTIGPVSTNFEGKVVSFNDNPTADPNFCSQFTVEFEIKNTSIGNIKDVKALVNLLPGMEYIPNSVKFKFPSNSTGGWVSSAYNPDIAGNLTDGFTLNFAVTKPSSGESILTSSQMDGTTNINANTILVQYAVNSKCGVSEGYPIFHDFNAKKVCGEDLPTLYQASKNLAFTNLSPAAFNTNISKSTIDPIVKNCSTGNKLLVKIINLGPGVSDGSEFIRVVLPEIIRFKSYNATAAINKNAPSAQPTYPPSSIQTLSWNMPSGLAVGDSIVMELFVVPNLNSVLPNSGTLSIITGKFISTSCNGIVCEVFKANGLFPLSVRAEGAPTTIESSVVQTSCSSATGSITFLSPIVTGYSYSIDNGISYSSSKTFSNLIAKNYQLRVKNDQSCETVPSSVVTKTINAQPPIPATPTITGGTGTFCVGQSTELKSSSATGNQWYRNGVLITGATSDTYVATTSGNYTVVVTNSSGCSATSAAVSLTFNALPAKPTTSGGSNTFCPGNVTLTSSSGTTYQWYKDGVLMAGETNQTLNVSAAGKYTVIVTNVNGCTSPASADNTVSYFQSPAAPTISGGDASPYCSDQSVVLTSTGSNNQWYRNGVAINGANAANYTVTQSGTYTVVVSNAFGCSTNSSNAKTIVINQTPVTPTITKDKIGPYCDGQTLTLSSSLANAYQWFKDGVAIANATSQTLAVTSSGEYQVQVISAEACSSAKSVKETITFSAVPSKPVISGAAAGTYCDSQTVTIQSSTGSSYQWYKNGVAIVGATNQTYDVTETGDYTVVITNAAGCASEASLALSFVINTRPTKPIINESPTTVCAGNTVILSTSATNVTYQWYKDGVLIPSATNATYGVTTTGDYTVIVTSSQGCASTESAAVKVTVNANPSAPNVIGFDPAATYCDGQTIILSSSSTSGNQWFKDGVAIPSATGQTLDVTSSGKYAVSVSNSNACSSGASAEQTIVFKSTVTKPIITTSGDKCEGSTTILRSSMAGNNQWYKNGVAIANATADTLVVTSLGNYQVRQVETSSSCQSNLSESLGINPKPTVSITQEGSIFPGNSVDLCAPSSATKTSATLGTLIKYGVNEQSASNFTFVWTKNTSAIANANAAQLQVLANSQTVGAGTYKVSIKDKVTGCEAVSSDKIVALLVAPTNTILSDQVLSNDTLCVQSNVIVKSQTNATAPYTLAWYDGLDNFDFQKSTATITKSQTDGHWIPTSSLSQFSYKYVVTDANACQYTSPIFNFYEGNQPSKPLITGGNGTYCTGDQVILVSNSTTGNQWFKNGVAISGAVNDSLIVTENGNYSVTLNAYNCSSERSDEVSVVINPYPTALIEQGIELAFNSNNCQNVPIELSAKNQTIAGTPTYQWYYKLMAGHIPQEMSATTQSNSVNTAGFYQVKVTVNGCSKTSEFTRIYEPPVLNVTATQICQGDSVKLVASHNHGLDNATYQWYRDNVAIVNAVDTVYQVKENGTYYVIVKNESSAIELTSCSAQVQISTPGNPEPLFNTISSSCSTSFVDLTTLQPAATNGKGYEWWTGTATARGTKIEDPTIYATAGTIYMWAKSGNGCYSLIGAPVDVILDNCCPDNPGRFKSNPSYSLLYGPANVRYSYEPGTYSNYKIALVSKLDGRIKQISSNATGRFDNVIAGEYTLYAFVTRSSSSLSGVVVGAKVSAVEPACQNVAKYDIYVLASCDYAAEWVMSNPEEVPTGKSSRYALVDIYDSNKIIQTSPSNLLYSVAGKGYQLIQIIYSSGLQNFRAGKLLEDVTATGLDIYAGQLVKKCDVVTLQLDGQLYLDSNNDKRLNGTEDQANLPQNLMYVKVMDMSTGEIMASSEVSSSYFFSFSMDFADGNYKMFLAPNDNLFDTSPLVINGWTSEEIYFTVSAGEIVENIYQNYNFVPLAMVNTVPRPQPIDPPVNFDGKNFTQYFCLDDTNKFIAVKGTNDQSILRWYADSLRATPLSVTPEANTSVSGTTTYFVSQVINGVEGELLKVDVIVRGKSTISGAITGSDVVIAGNSTTYRINPRDPAGRYTWTLPNGWTSNNSMADSIVVTAGSGSGSISVIRIDSTTCLAIAKSFAVRVLVDTDGDGVDDQTEWNDGTNPHEPCDFIESHVNMPKKSSWYELDCDGDGKKNWEDPQPLNFCVGGIVGVVPPLDSPTYNKYFRNGDCDGDGIPNHTETNGSGLPLDFDGDGTPNYLDLDSDNDGISDAIEGNKHVDTDDWANYQDLDSDNDGISDRLEGLADPDKDGIPNYLDLDSDGDCIPDVLEARSGKDQVGIDSNGDKMIDANGAFIDTNHNGWFDDSESRTPVDTDQDGTPDFLDIDSDNDCIPDALEVVNCGSPVDTDNDKTPDYLDADSDNDCIPDTIEVGKICGNPVDSDGDGIADFRDKDSDNDCIPDAIEVGKICGVPVDTDKDGIPDYLDTDSDGDCIPDRIEAGADCTKPVDTDNDGLPDYIDLDADGDCIPDTIEVGKICGSPVDSDGDGIADFRDKDSDNDCIPDAIEVGKICGVPVDTDKDGIPDYLDSDADNDCIPDQIEVGVCGTPIDSDGDGLPNYIDTDSDGDCIPDAIEVGINCGKPVDSDKDGIPDYLDLDSDNDCIADKIEAGAVCGKVVDTDSDGTPDYLDLDADNDTYSDNLEAGKDCANPADTDKDGIYDFRDLDSDGDGIPDKDEDDIDYGGLPDCDKDGVPNRIDPDFCEWFLPNGISPNRDGANDRLIIPGIRRLSKNRLTILNRWGNVVFETENYKNDWGGESNVGSTLLESDGKLPDGTYYYVIEFYGAYRTQSTYVYINRLLK